MEKRDKDYGSIIRNNLMYEPNYSPYCGDNKCKFNLPRTRFNGSQFSCQCGWISEFPKEFIEEYKQKWNK